jgi:hypothetical protein
MTFEDTLLHEQRVRDTAYFLWEQAGKPISDGVEFWLQAENKVFLETYWHSNKPLIPYDILEAPDYPLDYFPVIPTQEEVTLHDCCGRNTCDKQNLLPKITQEMGAAVLDNRNVLNAEFE